MACRLIGANHDVIAFDTRSAALERVVALGARAASSSRRRSPTGSETVLASLPSPTVSLQVATGPDGVIEGRGSSAMSTCPPSAAKRRCRSTTCWPSGASPRSTARSAAAWAGREKGALAVMVSGPRNEFEAIRTALEAIGRPFYIGEQPGSAQTMKLANNMLAANVLVATAEVVVMGVKAGLDPAVMIEVLNAGSGATSASRDKFPRAILPRTFDYGFATGLMVKDVRLYLDEAKALGVPVEVAEAIGRLWEAAARDKARTPISRR